MRYCLIFLCIFIIFPSIVGNKVCSSSNSLSQESINKYGDLTFPGIEDAEEILGERYKDDELVMQHLQRINSILKQRRIIWMTESTIILILFVSLIVVISYNSGRNKSKNLAIIRQIQEVRQMVRSNRKSDFQFLFSELSKEKENGEDSSIERSDLLFEKLQDLMVKERLYLNPNFCKEQVLQRIGADSRSLSYALKDNLNDATFSNYITQLRISEAIYLLENGSQYTIEEISEKVGFSTCRTFYRQFKKKYDMTPAEYRKLTAY